MKALAILLLLTFSGCDFASRLKSEWGALMAVMTGKPSPLASDPKRAELERQVRENAEILQEMIRVVWRREPGEEFPGLVSALTEGASAEGVYNGLVSSSTYREIEAAAPAAPQMALQFFAEQMAWTQERVKSKAAWLPADARPLPESVQLKLGPDTPGVEPKALRQPEEFRDFFARSSVPTLKRAWGAFLLEALKDLGPVGYGEFAAATAQTAQARKVDLGLASRARVDVDFHRSWAEAASRDRLTWEALNRVHRLLNAMDGAR